MEFLESIERFLAPRLQPMPSYQCEGASFHTAAVQHL